VLGNGALRWLGVVSFGIYLWHDTVLSLMSKWHFDRIAYPHPYLAWPAVALAGAALIAAVSWYAIERPVLSLRRLVPKGPRRPAPPVPDGLTAAPRPE
jgi:peptidoglycan/LPS O-acetylase OafA/YrhL